MNPNIAQKVRNTMKAGYDKSGQTYTPPMEVRDIRMMKETPMAKPKPKVSKSAEKARLKEERISKLRKELMVEKARTTAENNIKAKNSYMNNLKNIEQMKKNKDAENAARIKQIKASDEKATMVKDQRVKQESLKERANQERLQRSR
jgi:hypothetical protein